MRVAMYCRMGNHIEDVTDCVRIEKKEKDLQKLTEELKNIYNINTSSIKKTILLHFKELVRRELDVKSSSIL